jgi:hypothetical protein
VGRAAYPTPGLRHLSPDLGRLAPLAIVDLAYTAHLHRLARLPDTPAVTGNAPRGERSKRSNGELLVEVVLAVAIIGIAVVGLVAALGTVFTLSARSRVGAQGDLLLVRFAEALAAAPYEGCHAGSTPYQSAAVSAVPTSGLPAGISSGPWGSSDGTARTFELTVVETDYWNGDAAPATFASSCSGADRGSELLRLRVRSGDGSFDRRLTIVKRAA